MAELNIAIAEDNPLMLELLGSILEEEDGFHVVGKADNGEDAYQMIMDKKPDIVLLDVIMPKLDGITVLEKVRAANIGKDMPAVIMVTAAGNETVASAAFRNGASYYILKPFDREVLLDKIRLVGRKGDAGFCDEGSVSGYCEEARHYRKPCGAGNPSCH